MDKSVKVSGMKASTPGPGVRLAGGRSGASPAPQMWLARQMCLAADAEAVRPALSSPVALNQCTVSRPTGGWLTGGPGMGW
jgi:hypothetical protein